MVNKLYIKKTVHFLYYSKPKPYTQDHIFLGRRSRGDQLFEKLHKSESFRWQRTFIVGEFMLNLLQSVK